MRIFGLGVPLAAIALGLGNAAAWAQAPSPPGDGGTAKAGLREWFSATPREPSANTAPRLAEFPEVPIHYLRQATCNIPFTVDPSRNSPIELQLFVSTDRGQRWTFFSRTSPGTGSFTFRASQDGEYWFALKTIDRASTAPETKSFQPGLKVVFDTQPPQLSLDAIPHSPGTVAVKWDAQDAYLENDSLRIEYQVEPQGAWQTLSLPQAPGASSSQLAAQQLFRLEKMGGLVLVRAEVRDKAGNNKVVSRQVNLSGPASGEPASPTRNPGDSIATSSPRPLGDGSTVWPTSNQLPPPAPQAPPASRSELPPPKPSSDFPSHLLGSEAQRNPYFSTASQTREGAGSGSIPANEPEAVEAGQLVPGPSALPTGPVSQLPNPPPPVDQPTSAPRGPATANVTPDATNPTPDATPSLPAGDRPRMTNSREFSLDYEVEALVPTAVESVELWGTNDGGRNWTRWLTDDDRKSPIDVQVDRDGVYGFRVVVVPTRQFAGLRPQPGEPADIWIGVDTTPPTVRITAAPYGEGEHVGQFDIRWQAFDTGFGERPLTLSFSEHPDGPWNIIAAGLPNSGQYYWPVEPRIPREIYLRLEAWDDAGNVGEHRTTEPIKTAGLIPHARIRGFRVPAANNRSAARTPATR